MDKFQTEKKDHFSYYREDGLMNEEFWGKGENSDIPLIFEAVSVDKNGKETGKGGDTHFHFSIKKLELVMEYTIHLKLQWSNLINLSKKPKRSFAKE